MEYIPAPKVPRIEVHGARETPRRDTRSSDALSAFARPGSLNDVLLMM